MEPTTQDKILIEQRVTNEGPSVVLAFVLWFFLGAVSGHRFYLGRTGTAILQIVLNCILIGFIWVVVDLFLIPGMNHSRGGPATDQLDMVDALVQWVEQGQAPKALVAQLRADGRATVVVDGEPTVIEPDEVVVTEAPRSGWVVESQRGVTIALDIHVTAELAAEPRPWHKISRLRAKRTMSKTVRK